MSWTIPRRWVVGEIPKAAVFNQHVRDNLNEFAWASGWANLNLNTANGWAAVPLNTPRCRKIGGWGVVQGAASHTGAANSLVGSYLSTIRPEFELLFARQGNRSTPSGLPWVDIRVKPDSTITVTVASGTIDNVTLDLSWWVG